MQRSDTTIGKVIDGYRILELLGKGGMGVVYKAEDIALSREVALKMIAPELASKDSFLRRFQSEARALARVDSPFIVRIHALRKSGDHVFIVMEFVEGWTLSDELVQDSFPQVRALSILNQMLQAFEHAHSVGVVHRDIKPSNIMISSSGRVKVTDFGLAKLRREDGMSTVTQGIAGTARYMSPEQVQGKKIDHRSDIYSLGMTMYQMFAGKLPFTSEEGTYSILKRVVEEVFPPVIQINPSVPPDLSQIISKALEKNPDNRFQSVQEMLEAVSQISTESKGGEASQSSGSKGGETKKFRVPMALAAIGVVGLLIFTLIQFAPFNSGNNEVRNEPGLTNGNGQHENQPPPEGQTNEARLTVLSSPEGAQVLVDNVPVGTTPLWEHEVVSGDIRLRVSLDGHQAQDRVVSLEAGASESIRFDLENIELPSADNDPVSNDPVSNDPVSNDPVSNDPVRERQPDPDPPEVAKNTMRLRAEPAGAILVNNRRFSNRVAQEWPVGAYTLEFVDPITGASCRRDVQLNEGAPLELTCYFEHQLTITTRSEVRVPAPYAYVALNGESLGPTPITNHTLRSGTFTLEVSRFGYTIEDPQRTIVLEPTFDRGETLRKEFFLIRQE